MARLIFIALVLLMLAMADAQKPKKVKCNDNKFPSCYHKEFECPETCPENCVANCTSCKSVCIPPPPPKIPTVKCKHRNSTCYNQEFTCPTTCPRKCRADCNTCKSICIPPPPPPPPKIPKVKCKHRNSTCYNQEFTCPTACPRKCRADCNTCKSICIPPPPPPPPKIPKVKCKHRNSTCYNQEFTCPTACPRKCRADCNTCKSICIPPPPPPPPKIPKVKCKHRNSTCYNQEFICPATCPRGCRADCTLCKPICKPVLPPDNSPPPPGNYTPPPPDSSGAAGGKRVRCRNKNFPGCYLMEFRCPAACPDNCEVDCATCSPTCNCNRPGAVCQDPRFVGADGLTFYFHGKKDKDFCIVSDTNLHINAHFIGKRNEGMGRDFTWVQSLGILFDNHNITIAAKKTSIWDSAVDRLELSYDGRPLFLEEGDGAKWEPVSTPEISITRTRATNAAVIDVEGNFQIKAVVIPITEKESLIHKYGVTDDCFAHLDLGFKFYSLSGEVDGVLGQTYARNYVSRVKMGIDMPVLGGDREFASSDLFSTDCAVARFRGTRTISGDIFQYASLKCASGMDGRGVVCKR